MAERTAPLRPDVYERESCRTCGAKALRSVLQLPATPPANDFTRKAEDGSLPAQKCFPLEVMQCSKCGHSQLAHVVNPELLFKNYAYVSGTAPSFVKHFEGYARECAQRFRLDQNDLVVELGSNDATLLKAFAATVPGIRLCGVEPATNLAKKSESAGITTINEFFGEEVALRLKHQHGCASLVCANNVCAHVDDLEEFFKAARTLLCKDGVFVFEVQYLGDLIEKNLFDMVYHEHVDYHAVQPLAEMLSRLDLRLFDVERIPTHGGSIRCYAQNLHGPHAETMRLKELLAAERSSGILTPNGWSFLHGRMEESRKATRKLIFDLKNAGRSIVGFGAPAKATTLLYYYGLNAGVLDYIVDDNPLKQGTFTPGLHIPVVSSDALYEEEGGWPSYVLVLCWNFSDAVITKHRALMDNGVHFIVPLPELAVYP